MRRPYESARDLRALGPAPSTDGNNSPYSGTQRRQRSNQWRVLLDVALLLAIAYMALKVSGQSARIEQLEREMGPVSPGEYPWEEK